ncbi:MAG: Arc family DNA-binding protein [Clostridia bacterium]|nr:Arc family DNA-binding protein [Clostridia bacterium]
MSKNKIQTGIRFEPELLYKIAYIAKQNKRSLNAQLEFLALTCVKDYENENGKIDVSEDELYSK